MGRSVDLLQTGDAVVGVDLRGLQRGVAQQLLDFAHVGAAVHQVGGEGVPQHMRALLALDAGTHQLVLHQPVDRRAGDALALVT